jgi:hypothetical protein
VSHSGEEIGEGDWDSDCSTLCCRGRGDFSQRTFFFGVDVLNESPKPGQFSISEIYHSESGGHAEREGCWPVVSWSEVVNLRPVDTG